MYLLSILFAVALLFLPAAGVEREWSTQDICSSIKDVYGCSAIISVPTGFHINECRNKFFQVNQCKTRLTYKYPCPTWRKPGRTCDGWTTDETWIDTPCELQIETQSINICDKIRQTADLAPLIDLSTSMCECLPKALELSGDATAQNVDNADLSSSTTSELLRRFAVLIECFIENGMVIKDNKPELEMPGGALSASDGWTVIKAAEIDLAVYIQLAEAIAACYFGDCGEIAGVFTTYLKTSQQLMTAQLSDAVLTPWIGVLDSLKALIGDLTQIFQDLQEIVPILQSQVTSTLEDICQDAGVCETEKIAEFLRDVGEIFAIQQDIIKTNLQVSNIVRSMDRIIDLMNEFAASDDILDPVSLITSGQLQKIADIGNALKTVSQLPELVDEMKNMIPSITEFITHLSEQAAKLQRETSSIISDKYLEDIPAKAQTGIANIQILVLSQFESIENLVTITTQMSNARNNLPFEGGKLVFEVKVASYRRYSDVALNLLCSSWKRQHYSSLGLEGSFDYPEFRSCSYEKQFPWPNQHIPYFKFRFVAPDLAAFA